MSFPKKGASQNQNAGSNMGQNSSNPGVKGQQSYKPKAQSAMGGAGSASPSGIMGKVKQSQMESAPGMPKPMPAGAVAKPVKKLKIRSIDDLKLAAKNFGKKGEGGPSSGSGSEML